ncbi:protein ZNRD2 [Ictalurus furcatus]|uniref:protein ZNRD2 n=1 Tax=Ictalurus furcatus TaxID=66913 RepID=UPI00234FF796|nr:protein ZNRD2 [Ictalurus furcatus]
MLNSSMALNADEEDFEWEPPSEAEMKVIQARRERQDKISKLMGDYLLKGYRMLSDCCDICGTILLQDKQKKNYCVACQELDSDIDKDNPALNAQAALSQVRERQLASLHPLEADETTATVPEVPPSSRPEHCDGAVSGLRAPPPPLPPPQPRPLPAATSPPLQNPSSVSGSVALTPRPPPHRQDAVDAQDVVLQKLRWATQELQTAVSLESCVQLCGLIRACAETLQSLKHLQD